MIFVTARNSSVNPSVLCLSRSKILLTGCIVGETCGLWIKQGIAENRMTKNKPLGYQYAFAMISGGEDRVRQLVGSSVSDISRDAFLSVQSEDPVPAFLHSALCAMSLPTRRPQDESKPIIREDGRYALAISPRPVLQSINGKAEMVNLGVPYGAYPRVALIYLLSEAVKKQSREVYMGRNFTDWMRRLGYKSISYGPRGSVSQMKEQLDRLLACEWQIRWDDLNEEDQPFAVRDVKLSNEYGGTQGASGGFSREIKLSEVFYNHLIEHAVPLNEVAIRALKGNPTALDLYTYLAYRLPRVTSDRGQYISWEQLSNHLGSTADTKRFRQTIRETFQIVSSVYPNANVDISGTRIVLYPSPAPLEKKLVGAHLRLVGVTKPESAPNSSVEDKPARASALKSSVEENAPLAAAPKSSVSDLAKRPFPTNLRYGDRERPFRLIAIGKGSPWDMDEMASAFRKGFPSLDVERTDAEWLRIWEGFVVKFAAKRAKQNYE